MLTMTMATNGASQPTSPTTMRRTFILSMMLTMCSLWNNNIRVEAFVAKTNHPPIFMTRNGRVVPSALSVTASPAPAAGSTVTTKSSTTAGKGFGTTSSSTAVTVEDEQGTVTPTEEKAGENLLSLPIIEIKNRLLDLLPRMTGTAEEFAAVESYVNALEDKYVPVQTLDFLNLAMGGEWQLLFSTNLLGPPNRSLRLREMFQKVETSGLKGKLTNEVRFVGKFLLCVHLYL